MRFDSAACAAMVGWVSMGSAWGYLSVGHGNGVSFGVVSSRRRPLVTIRQIGQSRGQIGQIGQIGRIGQIGGRIGSQLWLQAGGGPEALEEFIESQASVSKSAKVKNPKLMKLASSAALPLSYLVGAAMTPSRRLAARAVGGLVATAAGGIGKSAVEEDVRKACPVGIARRLVELGVDGAHVADGVARLREDYGMEEADFGEACTQLYAVYLAGMARNPLAKTAELKELAHLKKALGLSNQQVGQAHADAAARFYRDVTRFASQEDLADEDHPDAMSIRKLLFLSERAFRQAGETQEAFTFEFARVSKALGMASVADAMDCVRKVSRPFYLRALASTRSKLDSGAVDQGMLARARSTLGIDDAEAKEMHIDAFAAEVRLQLGLKEEDDDDDDQDEDQDHLIKFKDGAYQQLSKLQEILNLSDEDADYEIAAATTDYWRTTALSAMQDAIASKITPSEAWTIIQQRQKELYLKDSSMKSLLTSMIMQAMGTPLEKTNTFARVNNGAATYDMLLDALQAKQTCQSVLTEAGYDEFQSEFEQRCFDPTNPSSACGFLSSTDRHAMYHIFLVRSVKTNEEGVKQISQQALDQLKQLRGMLGISELDGQNEIRSYFGPELQRVLTSSTEEILGGNATPELMSNLKSMINKVIQDYKLDDEMVKFYSGPLYVKAVEQIASQAPGGIPSKDDVTTLSSLRDLLNIPQEDTSDIHVRAFGEPYKKAIKEALGTTGVIRQEFREPLQNLRERLGVDESSARSFYLDAIGERMIPMVEYISNEMERLVLTQDQLAQRRGKDYGEDYFKSGRTASGKLGLGTEGNIMSDIMNLIDFYVENDIVEKQEVGTKKVETTNDDGTTTTEEIPVYESTYPLTALGLGCIDEKVAELCYRQFVVSSFTDQSPNAARYEASKSTFGGILGLSSMQMEDIGNNIGGMVYENYITRAMSTKDALDQQDMMFLANIQGKLGISSEQGEKMLLDVQKKILSEEVSALLEFPSGVPPTPEQIKAFREKCNSMGLDLQSDLGLSKSRLIAMFEYEITPGINDGTINADAEAAELLTEIQESLGLTEEEGEGVIETLITERAARLLGEVNSLLLRGLDASACEKLKTLVRYAKFVEGDLGLEVKEDQAWKAYGVFEASDFGDLSEEEIETQKLLIKTALGLSD